MADNITASVGDQAGIPDGTTYATREGDTGSGPAQASIVRVALGGIDPSDNSWMPAGELVGTIDNPPGDADGALLASDTYNATQDSPTLHSAAHKGVILWLDVTANPGGSETLTLEIWANDPVSSSPVKLYSFGAVGAAAANATYAAMLYPGAVDTDYVGKALAGVLPYSWSVKVVHSAAGNWTYSLGATLLA